MEFDLVRRMKEVMDKEEIAALGWPKESDSLKLASEVFEVSSEDIGKELERYGYHEEVAADQIRNLIELLGSPNDGEMVSD